MHGSKNVPGKPEKNVEEKNMTTLLKIIWLLDILNVPGMEFLDTTIPINGLIWLVIWIVMLLDE